MNNTQLAKKVHEENEIPDLPNNLVGEDSRIKFIQTKEETFRKKIKVPTLFYYELFQQDQFVWKKLFSVLNSEILDDLMTLKKKAGYSAKVESILVCFLSKNSKNAEILITLSLKEYFMNEEVQILLSEGMRAKQVGQANKVKKYKIVNSFKLKN